MTWAGGTLLEGRFLIEKAISSGGMGEVYKAHDKVSGGVVAVKRMLPQVEDKEFLARKFAEEVDVLKRLSYPGIPAFIHDFLYEDATCIVMEFISGTDLEVYVKDMERIGGQKGLDPLKAVGLMLQLCHIVEFLHNQRPYPIIHRDIKPANLILRNPGDQLYLVDFGLARNVTGSGGTKTMVGTVGFAPLEQYQGHPEPRSDLYSIGVTLHFLLSGEPPIPFQIRPLKDLVPGVNERLSDLIRQTTQNDLQLRPNSVFTFRRELEKIWPELGGEAPALVVETAAAQEAAAEVPAEWAEVLARSRRQKLDIHQEVEISTLPEGFGIADPMQDTRKHEEFQQQAMATYAADRGLLADAPPAPRRLWVYPLLLLAAIFGLTLTYYCCAEFLRPAWVKPMFASAEAAKAWSVGELAGVYSVERGVGVGTGHAWPLGLLESLLPPEQAGFLLEAAAAVPATRLSVHVKRVKDPCDAVVFADSWGLRIKSTGSDWQASRVSLDAPPIALGPGAFGKTEGPAPRQGARLTLKLPAKTRLSRLGVVLLKPGSGGALELDGLKLE